MLFNFDSTDPIYTQVAEQVEAAILTQTYREGQQIPSTTEISKYFHINPATVLKGFNVLVAKGLVEKKRGVGMFVSSGAYQRLIDHRRNEFYQLKIRPLIKEAQQLHFSEAALLDLIKRGFETND